MSNEEQAKAVALRDAIADILIADEIEVGMGMSVLMSMLITTAVDMAGIPPTKLVAMFAEGVDRHDEITRAEEESEGVQWLN